MTQKSRTGLITFGTNQQGLEHLLRKATWVYHFKDLILLKTMPQTGPKKVEQFKVLNVFKTLLMEFIQPQGSWKLCYKNKNSHITNRTHLCLLHRNQNQYFE